MQIRRLAHYEADTFIEFLQAMLEAMASVGGHALQNSGTISRTLRDQVQLQLEASSYLFLVAELTGSPSQLVGMLEASIAELNSVFQPKLSLHIHAIYVIPEHRRCGVARSLLERAFQWGQEQGCTEADLHVLKNSPAKPLYQSLGFESFQIEMRRKL